MDAFQVSLVGNAAYDAGLSIEAPAVGGEVDVYGVVIGGKQDRRTDSMPAIFNN